MGSWTDKGTCAPVVKEFLQGLHGKRVALFGTAVLACLRCILPLSPTGSGRRCRRKIHLRAGQPPSADRASASRGVLPKLLYHRGTGALVRPGARERSAPPPPRPGSGAEGHNLMAPTSLTGMGLGRVQQYPVSLAYQWQISSCPPLKNGGAARGSACGGDDAIRCPADDPQLAEAPLLFAMQKHRRIGRAPAYGARPWDDSA